MQLNYDSNEEKYFHWYLMELRDYGYIEEIDYQPSSLTLFEKQNMYYLKKFVRKEDEVKKKTLLHPLKYTPDYMWRWKEKARGVFFEDVDKVLENKDVPFLANELGDSSLSIIDVKGGFNQNESNTKFSIIQKVVYNTQDIYVQKIVPKDLFRNTFVPQRYLKTDKTMEDRKINFKINTLEEYAGLFD